PASRIQSRDRCPADVGQDHPGQPGQYLRASLDEPGGTQPRRVHQALPGLLAAVTGAGQQPARGAAHGPSGQQGLRPRLDRDDEAGQPAGASHRRDQRGPRPAAVEPVRPGSAGLRRGHRRARGKAASHAAGNSRRHSQPRTRPGAGRPGGQPWAPHPDRQRDCHRLRPLNREGETAMSEANEESEISEGMGRMLRTAMAGGMQMREAAARRQQAQQSQAQQADQQNQAQASKVATALRQDAYSREFWRTAGSEAIADRMTVAGQYSGQQPEARSAYMHMSDVLRNAYGINIEQRNRDHPTSVTDRHHALRDALDDYVASRRLDADASELNQQADQQQAAEPHDRAG